jgi:hypothetical protein
MPWLGRVSSATAARTANAGTMGARRRTGPDQAQTSRFARRVAPTLRHAGWRLERVLTDDGNEFQSDFRAAIEALGARHTNIRAGRPQTNGHVERPHRTIPEECWPQPSHGFSTCATAACNASSTARNLPHSGPACVQSRSAASGRRGEVRRGPTDGVVLTRASAADPWQARARPSDTRNATRARLRLCPTACPTDPEFPITKPKRAGIIIRRSQVRVLSPASHGHFEARAARAYRDLHRGRPIEGRHVRRRCHGCRSRDGVTARAGTVGPTARPPGGAGAMGRGRRGGRASAGFRRYPAADVSPGPGGRNIPGSIRRHARGGRRVWRAKSRFAAPRATARASARTGGCQSARAPAAPRRDPSGERARPRSASTTAP